MPPLNRTVRQHGCSVPGRTQSRRSLDVVGEFRALKSTRRSSTRILFTYFTPCMHSFGSMTPRFLTILKLPLFAWAMYMFIRT